MFIIKCCQDYTVFKENSMQTHENLMLTGVPVSTGLASGAAFLFQDIFERDIRAYFIEPHQVSLERDRLQGNANFDENE